MKLISPEQFRDAFITVLQEVGDVFLIQWKAAARDYTSFMRDTVLKKIADKLGVASYCSDYYTLDAVFYEEKDTEHFPHHTSYAKYLAVAIEHENMAVGSHVEMNKLQLFNAPLKVLITYAREGEEPDRLLAMYERIVRGADCFEDIATLRRQLVILGEPGTGNREPGTAGAFTSMSHQASCCLRGRPNKALQATRETRAPESWR